jgi:hypothetical protein
MKNEELILARLDALEAEVAVLKINAGLVEPVARDVAPTKLVEPKLSITHPIETSPIVLPTEAEYRRILSAVRDAYPQLRPRSNPRFADQDEAGFFREFCAAFERVSHLRRTENVDSKHALSWWVDETNRWLHGSQQIDGIAFLAAVIGAGDVSFVQRDEYGNAWAFGLATFGGRPATEAWRRVLKGQLLTPVAGRFGPPGPRPSVRLETEIER